MQMDRIVFGEKKKNRRALDQQPLPAQCENLQTKSRNTVVTEKRQTCNTHQDDTRQWDMVHPTEHEQDRGLG